MSKTLLQLMLESNVVWPIGASFAAQDGGDLKVFFYEKSPNRDKGSLIWLVRGGERVSCMKLKELAIDNVTSSISKEEYQAAGGWVERDGNASPVPKGTTVIVVWSDGDTTQFTQGDTSEIWSFRNPEILRYRIAVEDANGTQTAPAATAQERKDNGGACTIILPTGLMFVGARVMYQSPQTIVWEHKGVETACNAEHVTIDPDRSQIASQILYQLGEVSVSPALMLGLMKEMGWE